MSLPSDIPPINPSEYQMEIWKEVEQAVRKARASSSPGPNIMEFQSVRECFSSTANRIDSS